jgi:uncharacterized membrane protein
MPSILKFLFPRHWVHRSRGKSHLLLLLFWMAIAAVLRFTGLTVKPPWTDEFATLVFSLGNSYQNVPLDQVISLDALLQPLKPNPEAGVAEVISLLLNEDNHPPVYFVLSHLWLKLWPDSGEYVSLWAARSLPALWGVLSIPATYILARLAFKSSSVAHWAAGAMAVSPYAVFLAQEARHYTLAILLVIASLACLCESVRHLWQGKSLPTWLAFLWVAINSFGLSVHYFFCLTLAAQGMVLAFLWWYLRQPKVGKINYLWGKNWARIGIVATGTLTAGLVWLSLVLPRGYGHGMTDWIIQDRSTLRQAISPPFQALATWITMLSLLPVEASSWWLAIPSGIVMLLFFSWALPLLYWGLKGIWQQPNSRLAVITLAGFVAGAIALFFSITYGFGIDLTRGARYSFVYFPAVIVLVGASLATCWRKKTPISAIFGFSQGKTAVMIIWLLGLLGGITVCSNLGYQKYYRPDLLVPVMAGNSSAPLLIATTHKSLVQTGEMMGIAWELREHPLGSKTAFLLVHQQQQDSPANLVLPQALNQLPRPLDLWLVNFSTPLELNTCVTEANSSSQITGYQYQLYHCPV